jgi:hypothetical protein
MLDFALVIIDVGIVGLLGGSLLVRFLGRREERSWHDGAATTGPHER